MAGGRDGRKNVDNPLSFRSKTVGIFIPPGGPNVADLRPESMCGDEVECFNARRWSIGGIESVGTDGDRGISMVVRAASSVDLVLRLRRLGFLFMPGMTGLMKDNEGEEGSDVTDEASELKGAWIERPFMFLGRRGAGEVMGRSSVVGSETVNPAMPDRPAKEGGAKLESGMMFTGESGDEEGDGSERSDESAHDTVVVGDDSADSVVWVDVLLWCL